MNSLYLCFSNNTKLIAHFNVIFYKGFNNEVIIFKFFVFWVSRSL